MSMCIYVHDIYNDLLKICDACSWHIKVLRGKSKSGFQVVGMGTCENYSKSGYLLTNRFPFRTIFTQPHASSHSPTD